MQEGLANRITPFSTYYTDDHGNLVPNEGVKQIDTEKTYQNVMNRYKFGGLSRPGLYIDETVMRMCYTHRNLMAQLALSLIKEGKNDKALQVLQKCEKEIPYYNVPVHFRSGSFDMAEAYARLGKTAQAKNIIGKLWKNATEYMAYYLSLSPSRFQQVHTEGMTQLYIMQKIVQITDLVDEQLADKMQKQLETFYLSFSERGGKI